MTPFICRLFVMGVIGFLTSIASLLSIKVTSHITHMVSSAVGGVAASILGVYLFHNVITNGRALSLVIILIGSIHYAWTEDVEMDEKPNR